MAVALITGGSTGLGLAIARALGERGWTLILDARGEAALESAAGTIPGEVITIAGDVSDAAHRDALASAAQRVGRLDLLVNNASELGPSPMPTLDQFPGAALERIYRVNVLAPLALTQLLLPLLAASDGSVVNVTSDASVEPYPGWGGYGSSKAALDQLTAILGAERTDVHVYAFDPGDMRTDMHQRAFPGEDISDRPEPHTVVPAFIRLIESRPASGRYRAADLQPAVTG